MRIIKAISLLIFGLIILGSIFYLGDYVTKIRYSNRRVIEILKTTNPNNNFGYNPDFLNKVKEVKENFAETKLKLEQFINLIPKLKEDIVLKENLTEIINNLNCLSELTFLRDGLKQKEGSLDCLKNLSIKLEALKDLNILPIEDYQQKIANLLEILGEKEKKSYLVLIQYPSIPRPTGGFLAAYVILNSDKGKITFEGGHIIDLDNILTKKIIPPEPLQLIANQWFFHDLNWFYDFNLSAKKISELYKEATLKELDGIILINPSVISEIINSTGEIKMENYPSVINANNFNRFLKEQLEIGMKPGSIREKPLVLDDFFNIVFAKLKELDSEKLLSLKDKFNNFIVQKEIQLYFKNDILNGSINSLNFKLTKNFVGVNFSYLNKELEEDNRLKKVILKTEISNESQLINQLTISAEAKTPSQRKILTYVKIYLPQDIEILEARGLVRQEKENLTTYFQKLNYQKDQDLSLAEESQIILEESGLTIYKENGKLVASGFAYLSQSPFVLEYSLPEVLREDSLPYSYEIQILKQSGQSVNFLYKFILPDELKLGPTLFSFSKWIPLDKDLTIKVNIEKNELYF